MRLVLTIALLAACGGSDDPKPDAAGPHDEIACDTASWGTVPVAGQCERACVTKPANYNMGPEQCTATTPAQAGTQRICNGTFAVSGVTGCCFAESSAPTRFWECP
jgi:hypothetical protein